MENNVIPIERAIMKKQGRPRNSVVPRGKLIKEARLRYESNREKFARGLKHSMSPVTVAGIEQSKPSSPNKIKQVIEPLGLKYEDVIEINSGTPNADVRLIGADKLSTNSKTFKCSELNNLEFGELCSHMSFYLMFMEDLAARDDDKWMKDDPGAFGLPNSLTTVRSYITEKEKTPEIEFALEGLENALVAMLRNPAANTRSGSSLLEAYHSEPPLEEHLQTLDDLGVKVVGAIYDFWTTIYTGLAAFQMLETNKEVANDFPDMLLHHPWKRLAMVVDMKARINHPVYVSADTGATISALQYETREYIREFVSENRALPSTPEYWPYGPIYPNDPLDKALILIERESLPF